VWPWTSTGVAFKVTCVVGTDFSPATRNCCSFLVSFCGLRGILVSKRRPWFWCSELSSGLHCRAKWLSTDLSEVRTASIIILHGSTTQKTALNIILAAVRTWNLTTLVLPTYRVNHKPVELKRGKVSFVSSSHYFNISFTFFVPLSHTFLLPRSFPISFSFEQWKIPTIRATSHLLYATWFSSGRRQVTPTRYQVTSACQTGTYFALCYNSVKLREMSLNQIHIRSVCVENREAKNTVSVPWAKSWN
jgi:hypothetical protein